MTAAALSILDWAHAARPFPGEPECGDLEVVVTFQGGAVLGVFDGLGHGREAAEASRKGAAVLVAASTRDPVDLLGLCHDALRGSRGAAALLVSVSSDGRAAWAGVGNIEGWHLSRTSGATRRRREALISAPGVVGYQLPRLQRREMAIARGDLIALASDGISPRFPDDLRVDGELSEMSSAILRKHANNNDDALILLARYQEDHA